MAKIKNRDQLISIIQNDCTSRLSYKGYLGDTCAIGGLAAATGFDLDTIRAYNYTNIKSSATVITRLRDHLRRHFGLTKDQLHNIQYANDNEYALEDRRARILQYIETQP